MFYAPWCGHCQRAKPTWQELARLKKEGIKIGLVNCVDNPSLAEKYSVQSFPTFIYFNQGKTEVFNGERSVESWTQFIDQKKNTDALGDTPALASTTIKEEVVEHLTPDNFDSLVNGPGSVPWFIMFYAPWCPHCQRATPAWQELARSRKEEDVRIGMVNCVDHPTLASKYGVQGYPTFIYFDKGTTEVYNGERRVRDWSQFIDGKRQPNVEGTPNVEGSHSVEGTPNVEGSHSVDGTLSVEGTPNVEDLHSVEGTPNVEGSHSVEGTPNVEDSHSVEGTPNVEGSHSVEGTPNVEDSHSVEGTLSVEETPNVEGSHSAEGTPNVEGSHSVEGTPSVEETPNVVTSSEQPSQASTESTPDVTVVSEGTEPSQGKEEPTTAAAPVTVGSFERKDDKSGKVRTGMEPGNFDERNKAIAAGQPRPIESTVEPQLDPTTKTQTESTNEPLDPRSKLIEAVKGSPTAISYERPPAGSTEVRPAISVEKIDERPNEGRFEDTKAFYQDPVLVVGLVAVFLLCGFFAFLCIQQFRGKYTAIDTMDRDIEGGVSVDDSSNTRRDSSMRI